MSDEYGFPTEDADIRYERKGSAIMLNVHVSHAEFVAVLYGLWSSMSLEEQTDFLWNATDFLVEQERMPDLSIALRDGLTDRRTLPKDQARYIDIQKMKRAEHGED